MNLRCLVTPYAIPITILMTGCVFPFIPTDLSSGITGIVLSGPQCPVVAPGMDDDCADKPYPATIIVKTTNGLFEVTRFTADSNGEFRVPLPPGQYLLDPLPGSNGFPHASPQTVDVQAEQFTEITILYDTGIR